MVYRYYVKRGNKRFGPYYYRSYREKGKFKKEYLGTKLPKEYRKTKNIGDNFLLVLIRNCLERLLKRYSLEE